MRTKTAVSILISSIILAGPVLAIDSSTSTSVKIPIGQPVNVQQKINDKVAAKESRLTDIMAERSAKIASREAILRLKLQSFKDQKKAEITQRLNINLNRINQNQTQQMQKHLDLMKSILEKLEKRINNGSPDIKNQSSASAAIASSRASIASAEASVKTQADKNYTIAVSSESTVKSDVQKVRTQLQTDLQRVRKLVIEAKQSVGKAIQVAKSGKAENKKEGTASGQQ